MLQALCLAGNERRAFIEQKTRGNAALRDRVEALLGSYESGAFLEDPADPSLQKIAASSSLGERAGDWIGRYKLLEKFGEKGAGWFMWQRRKTR